MQRVSRVEACGRTITAELSSAFCRGRPCNRPQNSSAPLQPTPLPRLLSTWLLGVACLQSTDAAVDALARQLKVAVAAQRVRRQHGCRSRSALCLATLRRTRRYAVCSCRFTCRSCWLQAACLLASDTAVVLCCVQGHWTDPAPAARSSAGPCTHTPRVNDLCSGRQSSSCPTAGV